MPYIQITEDNLDREPICCALSNIQSKRKKEWLRERFKEGLVFYRSTERGKCFIEYMPAEKAWIPIKAEKYLYINCLWVSGSLKGHGYSRDLLEKCIQDARNQGKAGICILSSAGRKRAFLADAGYLDHKGFLTGDTSDCGITLRYLPLVPEAPVPVFKEGARHPEVRESGFVLYYTDQCPFTAYWVPRVQKVAEEQEIPFRAIYIHTREEAQKVPSPVTTYALFYNGHFLTQAIQSDTSFLKLAKKVTD